MLLIRMLQVLLVDWNECEMQQTKEVCDGVAAQKASRFFLQAGGKCVLATLKKAKADRHAKGV